MARALSVTIAGLEEAAKIPGWLEGAQRAFVDEAGQEIAEAIGEAAPHRSGALARSWEGRALSSTTARIASSSPYAKAQARGAYVTPRNGGGKALRFSDGGYRPAARIPATNYDKAGLRRKRSIILRVFDRTFGNLKSRSPV